MNVTARPRSQRVSRDKDARQQELLPSVSRPSDTDEQPSQRKPRSDGYLRVESEGQSSCLSDGQLNNRSQASSVRQAHVINQEDLRVLHSGIPCRRIAADVDQCPSNDDRIDVADNMRGGVPQSALSTFLHFTSEMISEGVLDESALFPFGSFLPCHCGPPPG